MNQYVTQERGDLYKATTILVDIILQPIYYYHFVRNGISMTLYIYIICMIGKLKYYGIGVCECVELHII